MKRENEKLLFAFLLGATTIEAVIWVGWFLCGNAWVMDLVERWTH
jgi:hypothetical protein